jgi:transcriptional regulator GlxA family with amidase domain
MSPRNFSRRFTVAMGCTPADFVTIARLRAARDRLMDSRRSIDTIAVSVGFRSADVFRRQFLYRFGITPTHYRERFATTRPSGPESKPSQVILS